MEPLATHGRSDLKANTVANLLGFFVQNLAVALKVNHVLAKLYTTTVQLEELNGSKTALTCSGFSSRDHGIAPDY